MGFEKFLFYLFALVLIFAAVRVITVRNPVHAALFLVLAFFTSAALWLLIEAEFLAITLVLVSYTHLRAHETVLDLVCRLLLEKNKIRDGRLLLM
ncbi:MAG TPA: NADH-quinone oxidoreductase subunit J, partial [Candidatus Competibacteraceae bacterium]|nr:NADH-quinone oxidoreductase subunit J [Candidatus Competibacteraceae bacterium]